MRVLVTDAHELAGLGAIRSLGRAGHRVTAAGPSSFPRAAASWSRYRRAYCGYPDPWQSQSEFAHWLLGRAGDFDLILPVSEAALLAAASCRAQMPGTVQVAAPSPAALSYTLSKRRSTQLALTIGITCPSTAFTRTDLAGLRAPYIVRTDNRLMPDHSYRKARNWYVEAPGELADLLDELDEGHESWIVQEHIVGTGAGAFLLRWNGRTVLEFAHERIHEVPFYGGVSSLRRSARDPAMVAAAAQLLAAIDFQGAGMVEFRRARGQRVPHFVEVNGRLWGSLALALHAGADFPARLAACYLDSSVPETSGQYAEGIYCRNVYPGELDYLRSVLSARGPVRGVAPPARSSAIMEFFALFFRRRLYYDYFWLKDPLPWVLQTLVAAGRVMRARWRAWRRRWGERRLERQFAVARAGVTPDLRAVLFLCYGNICRSAFASAYWNQNPHLPPARSAGFYPEPQRRTPPRIVHLAREFGVALGAHRSRSLSAEAVQQASAIIAMDGQNLADLLAAYPHARAKTWLLGAFSGAGGIADPYLLPEAAARESLRQVKDGIDRLVEHYAAPAGVPGTAGAASGVTSL